mgnify:FL=1
MQRYFAKDKVNNKIILLDSDIHHIKKVMRMNINDNIEVIYDKKLYLCKIIDNYDIEIVNEIKENNELNIDITIAIGLVKEQKFDLILQKLTELGVKEIIPLAMERSIIKLDKSKIDKKVERWNSICKEASEQSKRNIIPKVSLPMTLNELVKLNYDKKLVCSVKQKDNFINKYLQFKDEYVKMIIVIGPEGGVSDKEEEFLNNNDFISVSLGSRVLRVETAAIYVASVINYSCME